MNEENIKENSNVKQKILLIVLLVSVLLNIGLVLYFLLLSRTITDYKALPSNTTSITKTEEPNNEVPDIDIEPFKIIYSNLYDNPGLYLYNSEEGSTINIGDDAKGDLIWYSLPKIIDDKTISYEYCVRESEGGKIPYKCTLQKMNLINETVEDVVSFNSKPNPNGYQISGDIRSYVWNEDLSKVFIYVDDPSVENKISLYEYTVEDASLNFIDSFVPNPGRGGGTYETIKTVLSPDNSKVLLIDSFLAPNSEENDRGTLFVFDANTHELIFSNKGWYSDGVWINNNTIAATYQGGNKTDPASNDIYLIDLSQNSVEDTGYQSDSKLLFIDNLLLFTEAKSVDNGFSLKSLDFDNRNVAELLDNVVPYRILGGNYILVGITESCINSEYGCGMWGLNGFEPAGYGVFDYRNKILTELPINIVATNNIDGY